MAIGINSHQLALSLSGITDSLPLLRPPQAVSPLLRPKSFVLPKHWHRLSESLAAAALPLAAAAPLLWQWRDGPGGRRVLVRGVRDLNALRRR